MPTDFIGLFAILAGARVRFVLVGGLALVLHGVDRLTAGVDLVIDLSTESARSAVEALTAAGYRPLAPVDPIALAEPAQRLAWLTAALELAYKSGAIQRRRPGASPQKP
jgi:hypothetical protein